MPEGSTTKPLITLTSDFGWSSQGVGMMKAVAHLLAPHAHVIDLTHDVVPFSTIDGASELETLAHLPWPGIHVCVVDPGVGSSRRVVGIETARGDVLIGPDNGVLIPAAHAMGGVVRAVNVVNSDFMLSDVSSTFHGRDIMVPAAGALASGTEPQQLGESVRPQELAPPPFTEASWNETRCEAVVIHINRYGTAYLNILNSDFVTSPLANEKMVDVTSDSATHHTSVRVGASFSDVDVGQPILFGGHYGRLQLAVNQGSFAELYGVEVGATVLLHLPNDCG